MSIIGEAATAKVELPEIVSPYIEYIPDASGNIVFIKIGNFTNKSPQYLAYNMTSLRHFEVVNTTSVGQYAFYKCSALQNIPSAITSIGTHAFDGCTALTDIPMGVTTISDYAFYNCSGLKSTELPSGLTKINTYAFTNCTSLAISSIPDGVTQIAGSAFRHCDSIVSLDIPASMTVFGTYALNDCSKLKTVTLRSTSMLAWKTQLLPPVSQIDHIYVPSNLVSNYQTTTGWSDYAAKISAIT